MRLPLIAAVVAVLLLPATLAQAPAPPGPDLRLVAVELPGGAPSVTDGVRQATPEQILVTVRNAGPGVVTAYQIVYSWVGPGGEMPLNGGAPASVDVREERLEAGQARSHAFDWALQPGQVGPGAIKAVVQAGGSGQALVDATPGDNQRSRDVHVDSYGIAVTVDGASRLVHPGETIYARGQVQNVGNVPAPVMLQALLPAGSPLSVLLEPPAMLVPAGGSADYLAYITMPGEDPEPFGHRISIQATPEVGAARQAQTGQVESTFAPYAADDHLYEVSGGEGTFFAAPARPARALFTVRNEGRQPDVYDATVEAPEGWDVRVSPARFVLDPGTSQSLAVTAAIADGDATAAAARLRVASRHPVPAQDIDVELRPSGAAPQIVSAAPEQALVYVADELRLRVVLANPGDEHAAAALLAVRLAGAGREEERFIEAPAVAAGASDELVLALGRIGHGGALQVGLRWHLGPSPVSFDQVVAVRDPRLLITPPTAAEGLPGQEVAYLAGASTFRLRNAGTAPEQWDLRVATPAGAASLAGAAQVTVLPGETRSVAVRQVLPSLGSGNATLAPLTLHAAVAGRPHLQWNATVATRVVDPIAPVVAVPLQAATWSLRDALQVRAVVQDLSAIRSVDLLVDPPGLNWSAPLAPSGDGSWSGNASFREAGAHVMRVRAVDVAGNVGLSPPWAVDVVPDARPRLQVPAIPANGSWDVSVPIAVVVEGAQAASIRYQLRQEGQVVVAGDQPLVEGRAEVPLDGAAAGEAVLHIEALGAGGSGEVLVLLDLVSRSAGNATGQPEGPGGDGGREAPAPALAPALALLLAACARARKPRA